MRFLSPCLHILSNGEDGLLVRQVASERRSQFIIKLVVFKKKCQYYDVGNNFVSNTVSKHKWGYKLLIFPAVAVPLDQLTSYLHKAKHETNRTWQHLMPFFAWIRPMCRIIFPIIHQCKYFFTSMMIRSWLLNVCSLFLSNTITKIWFKRSMDPYVAKKILSPGKWRFLILLSDSKISKLTMCF